MFRFAWSSFRLGSFEAAVCVAGVDLHWTEGVSIICCYFVSKTFYPRGGGIIAQMITLFFWRT